MGHVMLQHQITEALSALIGLPLWGATRAANMSMFAFGERRSRLNRKGAEVEVGDYALHIQCPWRIVGPDDIVVGSEDRMCLEDESSDWETFKGPSRCEARIGVWLTEYAAAPLRVERVEGDWVGGFKLLLERGFVLEAFPADSVRGVYSEYWRLFRPGEKSHFVVTAHGVET